jgi:DNA-binding XRE family transcriptional regulator
MYFGKRLMYIRKNVLKVNQEAMAEILDCSQGIVSNIENGMWSKYSTKYLNYLYSHKVNLNWIFVENNEDIQILREADDL